MKSHVDELWPKGPYTQQIQGILPSPITDDIVLKHLQTSGKQLKSTKTVEDVPTNIDYSKRTSVLYGRLHSRKKCNVLSEE